MYVYYVNERDYSLWLSEGLQCKPGSLLGEGYMCKGT